MTSHSQLAANLGLVKLQIAEAARRSGRSADDVKLVAVTKYVPAEVIPSLVSLGCSDLGESRPQALWEKAELLAGEAVRWHLIGHLQRNKVERTLPLVSLVHSGDSLRLLRAIDAAAATVDRRVPVLMEVNVSGDATKHGFPPDEVEPHLTTIADLPHVEVCGLMCMASREGDLGQARREFSGLREMRDRLRSVAPPQVKLDELSMGMSGDFEVAIEEGATIVRVGSALFQGTETQA
jgi:PLP dependent protein